MADITLGLGDDTFVGPKNEPNTIRGDAVELMGHVTGGNDTIMGGENSTNTIIGDATTFTGNVTGGADTLIGGKGGVNFLIGDAVDSGGGSHTGGSDRLVSAPNTTDHMWGDFQSTGGMGSLSPGPDTFACDHNNGNDFIYDFQQGLDTIDFSGLKGGHAPTSLEDLNILVTDVTGPVPDSGPDGINDSVIQLSNNDSVTVVNFVGLAEGDFMFV